MSIQTHSTIQTNPAPLRKAQSEALIYEILATNLVPDFVIRAGIRQMLKTKIKEETCSSKELQQARLLAMVKELSQSPIAIETAAANEQHYQVPTEFFKLCLGQRLKYSSAYYSSPHDSLDQAEEAMLKLTVTRAEIKDGDRILELGCGWGSLTLYMAERFAHSKITAVSNSSTQRQYIESECVRRGITNVEVITCDINDFQFYELVDRVISVEMFEHMKNYRLLLERIEGWLCPGGKLFVHIFSHKELCYHYEDRDGSDWMTRNFFSGGIMPANDLLLYFQEDLKIEQHYIVSGQHYEKTANHWLANMDRQKKAIMPILADTYGADQALRWWAFWRLFFMSCAELWGYGNGEEWMVSHYLFSKHR
ncbi:cyclopropane-fatty-acyl-phospholipid synthase family protein [soil metagenome]